MYFFFLFNLKCKIALKIENSVITNNQQNNFKKKKHVDFHWLSRKKLPKNCTFFKNSRAQLQCSSFLNLIENKIET